MMIVDLFIMLVVLVLLVSAIGLIYKLEKFWEKLAEKEQTTKKKE